MNDDIRPGFPEKWPPDSSGEEAPTQDAPTQEEPGAEREPQTRPRRVLRSREDRILAGVAGGLGDYFAVDPLIFRIGFALSIFFGGLGVLAYVLLAIFVPRDDGSGEAVPGSGGVRAGGFWRGVGLVLLALLAIGGLFGLAGGAAFAVAVGWGVPVAIVVIAVGSLLALAAFRGGARWLIPPAIAIALGASVAAASDVDFSGGFGERSYRPLSADAIPAEGYRLGVGELLIDLRELDWEPDDVVELETTMGAGMIAVYVPERVCVAADTHVGAGESIIAGDGNEGIDVDEAIGVGSNATPRLELDAELDFGELVVVNSDSAPVTRGDGHDWDGWDGPDGPFGEDAGHREAQAQACGAE